MNHIFEGGQQLDLPLIMPDHDYKGGFPARSKVGAVKKEGECWDY